MGTDAFFFLSKAISLDGRIQEFSPSVQIKLPFPSYDHADANGKWNHVEGGEFKLAQL